MAKLTNMIANIVAKAKSALSSQEKAWHAWRWIEAGLLAIGFALIGFFGAARLESCLGSQDAIKTFESFEPPLASSTLSGAADSYLQEPDFGGWDEGRIGAYREAVSQRTGTPLGLLAIPKIHLVAPLMEGTDNVTLNHAVGRIEGSARLGEEGNIGIAGHRDGFFRGLKDVKTGDLIELKTHAGIAKYNVGLIQVVTPTDVSVLKPHAVSSLTLVTCYPFYYIGSAPKRFVVTAYLSERLPAGPTTSDTR